MVLFRSLLTSSPATSTSGVSMNEARPASIIIAISQLVLNPAKTGRRRAGS